MRIYVQKFPPKKQKKIFSENDALESFFKSRGSLIKISSKKKVIKILKKNTKSKFFEFFFIKFCELSSKENFFLIKNFNFFFFFKVLELFIYLTFFHGTEA